MRHRSVLIVSLALLAAWSCVLLRFSPPAVRAADIAPDQFSGERAFEVLSAVLEGVSSHPTGSAANVSVRERIVTQLEQLGYTPGTTTGMRCGRGNCMSVTNVMATLPGGEPVVLVAAHYDSVGAGPGASDDGVGVAVVLEVARALRQTKPANTVAFLFTDGEEMGLHGAEMFMESSFASRVAAVINVDNRGTSGPSLMFETAGATTKLAPLLGGLARPFASSLFGGVYEQLPNDTDFTRFRSRGAAGFNFAFIGNVANYHTSRDSLANVDRRSMQHHGDNALALAQQLADSADLSSLQLGDRAVYFDWLGLWVVHWPERHAMWLALVGCASLLLAWALAVRRPEGGLRRGGRALGFALLTILVPTLLGALVVLLLFVWRDMPLPLHAALGLPVGLVVASGVTTALSLGPRLVHTEPWLAFASACVPLAFLGVGVAWAFPPASYLFAVGSLLAGAVALLGVGLKPPPWVAWVAIAGVVFVVATQWLMVAHGVTAALDASALPIVGLAIGLVLAPCLPLWSQVPSLVVRAGAGLTLGLLVASFVYPAFDADSPQRLSIVHVAIDDEPPVWWVDTTWGSVPSALQEVAAFGGSHAPALPIIGMNRVAEAPGPPRVDPVPSSKVQSDAVVEGRRQVEVQLASNRGADMLGLLVPASVGVRQGLPLHGVAIEGPSRFAGMRLLVLRGVSEAGTALTLTGLAGEPMRIFVLDATRGLGASGDALVRAREPRGVASQEGDLAIVVTEIEL